jgi:glycolate oxidase FAD binding subunit
MAKSMLPKSEEELSDIIKSAKANGSVLSVRGGGTRPIGNPVSCDAVVETKGLKGISLYEPGALTIVAKAGTPLAEIEKALEKENQHLPFEPANYAGLFGKKGKSTIGGVVAAAVSGPRRIQAGACRDSLIGVRFVSGEGDIIKNGGRVMKNVTGYDLVKLMAGSYGTLGVLSEVSFKVLPKPELTGVVSVSGLNDSEAVTILAKALSSPFDISGAAHLQKGAVGEATTLIRVEGFTESIKYRTQELKKLIAPLLNSNAEINIDIDPASTKRQWTAIRDLEVFQGGETALWRLSVKPSDGPKIVAELSKSMNVDALYDWGGGLVWLQTETSSLETAKQIRMNVTKLGGHATLIRRAANTDSAIESFQPEPSRNALISENLRLQFDPAGILNLGLMSSVTAKHKIGA